MKLFIALFVGLFNSVAIYALELDVIVLDKDTELYLEKDSILILEEPNLNIELIKGRQFSHSIIQLENLDNLYSKIQMSKNQDFLFIKNKFTQLMHKDGITYLEPMLIPYESESKKNKAIAYMASMTKMSRLLSFNEILNFQKGYFLTEKAGILDISHIQSAFNDTLKCYNDIRSSTSSLYIDRSTWHVLGRDGFNFEFKCSYNETDSIYDIAVSITLLKHYIWEILQMHPKVVEKAGYMSLVSAFALDDIASVYVGVCMAYRFLKKVDGNLIKGNAYLKNRKESFREVINLLKFINSNDRKIQDNYYEIVKELASTKSVSFKQSQIKILATEEKKSLSIESFSMTKIKNICLKVLF